MSLERVSSVCGRIYNTGRGGGEIRAQIIYLHRSVQTILLRVLQTSTIRLSSSAEFQSAQNALHNTNSQEEHLPTRRRPSCGTELSCHKSV